MIYSRFYLFDRIRAFRIEDGRFGSEMSLLSASCKAAPPGMVAAGVLDAERCRLGIVARLEGGAPLGMMLAARFEEGAPLEMKLVARLKKERRRK